MLLKLVVAGGLALLVVAGCGGGGGSSGGGSGSGNGRASPSQIVVASGDHQVAIAGSALPNPLVVAVLDSSGNPVAGLTVDFSVTGGGGSVSASTASTDASGRAQT